MTSKNFLRKKFKKIFFIPKKSGMAFLVLLILFLVLSGDFCWAEVNPIEWAEGAMATAFWKITQLSGTILVGAMWFLNLVTSETFYNKILFGEGAMIAINTGWVVVRDFLNLFFILMLLLIAIGTILRVPSYGDKKMVFNVVLAALLINFSKPIALVFIDISQLAMSFFMSALDFNDGKNFSDFILDKIQLAKSLSGTDKGGSGDFTGPIIMSVSSVIFFLVMAVMMFTLAASLLVRVVAYWILIILSPMAMFGLAMPRTGLGSLNRDWMQKMFYWSFFGPVMMFFLWLTTLILVQVIDYNSLKEAGILEDIPTVKENGRELVLNLFEIIIPYVAAIYLLFYGYDASKKVSTGAATSVLNWGSQKMKQYGKKISKWSALGTAGVVAGAGLGGAAGMIGAGVGAGVGGVAGYYGGRGMKNRIGDKFQGFREKSGEKGGIRGAFFSTEEQKKKKREQQKAERIAKFKGGEEEKKYWRGRANQQKKEWDDLGVEDNFLQDKMKSGNEAERKASAMLLSDRGKIKTGEDFEKALTATGGDKVLEGKIRKKLKEENIYSFMSYDLNQANNALKNTGDDRLNSLLETQPFLKDLLKNSNVNIEDGIAVNEKLKEYKNNEILLKQDGYDKQLNALTPKEIANQSNELYEKEAQVLENYFVKQMKFSKKDSVGTKSLAEFQKELDKQGNGYRASLASDIVNKARERKGFGSTETEDVPEPEESGNRPNQFMRNRG